MTDLFALRNQLIGQTRQKVEKTFGEREIHAIRASNAMNDIEAIANLLYEHTKEWYHYHYPELESMVSTPEHYLKIVYNIGHRDKFTVPDVQRVVSTEKLAIQVCDKAKISIGGALSESSLAEIRLLSLNALNLLAEKKALEQFVQTELEMLTPNFVAIAGPVIAGKMISHTGSIEKLSKLPASSIQILGAEKALFRYLKNNKKGFPPKHGYLFSHGLVHQLPAEKRGRMARTLAAKLSIAIKTDYFNPQAKISDQLLEQLDKRFKSLTDAKTKNKPKRNFPMPSREPDRRPNYTEQRFSQPIPARPSDPGFRPARPYRPSENRFRNRIDSNSPGEDQTERKTYQSFDVKPYEKTEWKKNPDTPFSKPRISRPNTRFSRESDSPKKYFGTGRKPGSRTEHRFSPKTENRFPPKTGSDSFRPARPYEPGTKFKKFKPHFKSKSYRDSRRGKPSRR